MPSFLLQHRHAAAECAAAFAAWGGVDSPLRGRPVASTCLSGEHTLTWRVEASDAPAALGLLPAYVAERTQAVRVRDVRIP